MKMLAKQYLAQTKIFIYKQLHTRVTFITFMAASCPVFTWQPYNTALKHPVHFTTSCLQATKLEKSDSYYNNIQP